jgi:tRNA dimethylallyltransferase
MHRTENGKIVVIAGPTASGKSRLALALARESSGEIINADSMQVYHPFPILTAQPDREEISQAVHHLYGHVSPPDVSTAAEWADTANGKIKDILKRGNMPFLVGGTGLYLEFLLFGASILPNIPEETRNKAKSDYAANPQKVWQILETHDPEIAARLKPGDTQRAIRAYETWLATDKPLSYWQKENFNAPDHSWKPAIIVLLPDREWLYAQINARFEKMMKSGALEEALKAEGIENDHPALKAVGIRELLEVSAGRLSLERATAKVQTLSRNYAKRQFTWFRNRLITKTQEASHPLLILENNDFAENCQKSRDFLMHLG